MVMVIRRAYSKVNAALNNQRGAQAIEWIALAGVILAVFSAVQYFFGTNPDGIGSAISDTISNIIRKISK